MNELQIISIAKRMMNLYLSYKFSLTLTKRPGGHRLQIRIQRVGIDVIEFSQRIEGHHGHRRAIGALAAAQHGVELLGILVARQRTAFTRRQVGGRRPVGRGTGNLAARQAGPLMPWHSAQPRSSN